MTSPIEHLTRLASFDGQELTMEDLATFKWIAAGMAAYLDSGLPLERVLGLPCSAGRTRTAGRDYWLTRAAQAMGDDIGPAAVKREAEIFIGRKWPVWSQLGMAPPHATECERAFFRAAQFKDAFPASLQQWCDILNSGR